MCERSSPQKNESTYILVKARQNIKSPYHSRERVKKTLFGKRLTAALPTSPTERIHAILVRVRLFRAICAIQKSLGYKSVRIGKVARMSMDGPHVARKVGTSWEVVALVIETYGIGMRNAC
jgi:hypothetical protein